jgi:hypothetical protein
MTDLAYINSVILNLSQMKADLLFLDPSDPIHIFLSNSISSLVSLKNELKKPK